MLKVRLLREANEPVSSNLNHGRPAHRPFLSGGVDVFLDDILLCRPTRPMRIACTRPPETNAKPPARNSTRRADDQLYETLLLINNESPTQDHLVITHRTRQKRYTATAHGQRHSSSCRVRTSCRSPLRDPSVSVADIQISERIKKKLDATVRNFDSSVLARARQESGRKSTYAGKIPSPLGGLGCKVL